MRIVLALAVLPAALIAQAAIAADRDIIFYQGNSCSQAPGPFNGEAATLANCSYGSVCLNDEFRSVWIGPKVRPGTVIQVWDDPKGSDKDDWAKIVIHKVTPTPNGERYGAAGMCIPTFQVGQSGADYEIYYHRINGLDGKVSLIRIIPGPAPKPAPPTLPRLAPRKFN